MIKRLWGIRHIRYTWHCWRLECWLADCRRLGLGIAANPADLDHLDAIRDGRA